MTQSFRDINQPIAQLIATLIKCRKADILGLKDSYIRKVHAGYRGAVIQTDEREYKSQYFGLYRSNTQSSGSAESGVTDVNPMIVKFNRFKRFWLLLSVLLVVWAFWPDGEHGVWGRKVVPSPPVKPRVLGPSPGAAAIPVAASSAPAPAEPKPFEPQQATAAPPEAPPQTKEPLYGKQLHVAGDLSKKGKSIMLFIVSDGTHRMFEVTSEDLENAGYTVKRLSNCMATVKFESVVRPVVCDAPFLNTGGQDRPLVVDAGTGARSDGRITRYGNTPLNGQSVQSHFYDCRF